MGFEAESVIMDFSTFRSGKLHPDSLACSLPVFVAAVLHLSLSSSSSEVSLSSSPILPQQWPWLLAVPGDEGGGRHGEGYLDEQFHQLEDLEDDLTPNFVEEIVTLFFRDSARLINNVEQALEKTPHDFIKLDRIMYQLKGSSSSIGAIKVQDECSNFRQFCSQGNMEGCLRSFQKLKREHAVLRQKLDNYFEMLKQVTPTEMAAHLKRSDHACPSQ